MQHLQAFRVREQSVAQVVDVLDDLELAFGTANGGKVSIDELEAEKRRFSSREASSSAASIDSSQKRMNGTATRQQSSMRPATGKGSRPTFEVVAKAKHMSTLSSVDSDVGHHVPFGNPLSGPTTQQSRSFSEAHSDGSALHVMEPQQTATLGAFPPNSSGASLPLNSTVRSRKQRQSSASLASALARLEPLIPTAQIAQQSHAPAPNADVHARHLTSDILQTSSPVALQRLYVKHNKDLNAIHVAAMMAFRSLLCLT